MNDNVRIYSTYLPSFSSYLPRGVFADEAAVREQRDRKKANKGDYIKAMNFVAEPGD